MVWYTTGYTHVARPEDFPVMPAETIGFRLVPRGSRAIPPSTSPIGPVDVFAVHLGCRCYQLEGHRMSIWERLSAATHDLSLGGQISSLLGFGPTSEERKLYAEPDNEVPFTVGVIVLSAKMAKADGSVAADEVKAFQEAFKVSAAEMKQVAPVFNSAKRTQPTL